MIPVHVLLQRRLARRRSRPTRIRAQSPRDVSGWVVLGVLIRTNKLAPLAMGLAFTAGAMVALTQADPTVRGTPVEWIAWGLAVGTAVALVFLVRRVADLRRLLETGMVVPGMVVGEAPGRLWAQAPRAVSYTWTFYGQSFNASAPGFLWLADEIRPGTPLTLLCDPSEPREHLVTTLYGLEVARD